jgi:hypothetical protein
VNLVSVVSLNEFHALRYGENRLGWRQKSLGYKQGY